MRDLFEELKSTGSAAEAIQVLTEHKKETLQLAVIAVVVMMAVLMYLHKSNEPLNVTDTAANGSELSEEAGYDKGSGSAGDSGSAEAPGSGIDQTGTGLSLDTDGIVYVDIGGAVKQPMLAELPAGSRVEDAIEAAGGLTKKADLSSVNRAQILTDGEKIYIPKKGETAGEAQAAGESPGSADALTAAGISGGKININTADAILLQQLTGVGPVTAQKIVDYREQNGKFKSPEELMNVSGIGEKTFEKMQPDITI